jgi:ribosomal protein S18 acetylase RimI-like enzyme
MPSRSVGRSTKIREYVKEDRPFLERSLLATLREEAPFDPLKLVVPPKDWGRTYSTWLLKQVRQRGGHILIAEVGRKRAGLVIGALQRASKSRHGFEPARPCWVFDLYVVPKLRRTGIGNQLMGEIEGRFRAWGRDFVHMLSLSGNERALALYRARGYAQRVYTLGKWLS